MIDIRFYTTSWSTCQRSALQVAIQANKSECGTAWRHHTEVCDGRSLHHGQPTRHYATVRRAAHTVLLLPLALRDGHRLHGVKGNCGGGNSTAATATTTSTSTVTSTSTSTSSGCSSAVADVVFVVMAIGVAGRDPLRPPANPHRPPIPRHHRQTHHLQN